MKIKLFAFIFFINISVFAQNIGELFMKVPNQYFKNTLTSKQISNEVKQKLLSNQKADGFWMNQYDAKNGYLNFITDTDSESLAFVMTYWKFTDGLLIAIVTQTSAMCADITSKITFLTYKNGQFQDVSKTFMPALTLKSFEFDPKFAQEVKKFENHKNIAYWVLPQKGKEIKIRTMTYECNDDFLPKSLNYYTLTPSSLSKFQLIKKPFNEDDF
jgi:hypothetical protein